MKTVLLFIFALAATLAQAAPRNYVDAAGRSVAVPDKPARVLALSELDLDALLALQVRPVGATRGRGQSGMPAYLGKASAGIPVAGNFASPVLDLVIGMQPDLILAGGIPDPELLAQLNRIAPTVVTYKPGEAWHSAFRRVAELVQRKPEGERFMADYQARAAALRERLGPQRGASVSVVRWNPNGPAYMLRDAFASLVLADLQLARPASQQQPGAHHSPPLSLEALERIDADWLFLGTLDGGGPASKALQAASASPAFQRLDAVRNKRMVSVDGSLWTSPGGPLAALAILSDVEKAMVGR